MMVTNIGRSISLLAVFATAGLGGAARANAGPPDLAIKEEIARRIAVDPGTMLDHYDVKIREGIVALEATVDTPYRDRRAVDIAKDVKGVRAVVDRIVVRRFHRRPLFLKQDVVDTLAAAPALESSRVITQVERDGEVTLTGTVDSYAQLHLAEALALDVKGVTGVDNNLGVEIRFKRPDGEITQDVESQLASDVRVDAGAIDVQVDDGHVRLSGAVASALERVNAEEDARVMGVRSVDASGLDVDRASGWLERELPALPPNRRLRRAIEDAWTFDGRVEPVRMAAHVDRGLVVLVGSARSAAERQAAAEDAADAVGALGVIDRLVLDRLSRADRVIEARVRAALRAEPLLDPYKLELFAIAGDVYLTGTTTSSYLRQLAGAVAAGARGVHRISNNITVAPPPLAASDAELERAVERELFWSPYVDNRDITVRTRHGEVTLRGTVDSWLELDEARHEALAVGASAVHNLLAVRGWR